MRMNLVAIIAGGIVIFAIILALILTSYQESDVRNTSDKEIQSLTDKTDYKLLPKDPITSGPFQINHSEYAIGEKIFLSVHGLVFYEKGQIDIMRPLNATDQFVWDSIPFDGGKKSSFNFYFEPQISKREKFCSIDDIMGKWSLVFTGTSYPNLDFEITETVIPGTNIEPVC